MNTPLPPSDENAEDNALAEALAASRVMEDAPEPLVRRAIDLWAQARPAAGRLSPAPTAATVGALRKLVAALVFDSAERGLVAAGRRGTSVMSQLASRQMLFTLEGRDIDIRLTPLEGGTRWAVSGQVLGPDAMGWADLRSVPRGDEPSAQSAPVADALPWNDLAEFEFAPVTGGDYCLCLTTPDWSADIPLAVGVTAQDVGARPSDGSAQR